MKLDDLLPSQQNQSVMPDDGGPVAIKDELTQRAIALIFEAHQALLTAYEAMPNETIEDGIARANVRSFWNLWPEYKVRTAETKIMEQVAIVQDGTRSREEREEALKNVELGMKYWLGLWTARIRWAMERNRMGKAA